jgi:endonuclease YncB( thermonuclease family)
MKRLILFLIILALVGCMPPLPTMVPAATLAAQTMAAIPKTDTPTLTATSTATLTPTPDLSTPTPLLDLTAPGAYCLPTNTERIQALVTKVLDGQTIEVAARNQTFRVRYLGLNAPKIAPTIEWQAPQALALNEHLVAGGYVTLIRDITDTDAEGFYLRYVVANNVFVNYEMVLQGYASVNAAPPDVACENSLIAAQVEAQSAVLGIWQPTPAPTWTISPTPTITLTPGPPTSTRMPPCNCNARYSCNMFSTHKQAQSCFDYCRKTYGVQVLPDNNRNGLVCEGLH